jgi:predicted nucleic acid binding AN1-type Zn finger protein
MCSAAFEDCPFSCSLIASVTCKERKKSQHTRLQFVACPASTAVKEAADQLLGSAVGNALCSHYIEGSMASIQNIEVNI